MEEALKKWMKWIRQEQAMVSLMTVSYMPDKTKDYKDGRIDGLRSAESWLGLLMIEKGIDLRQV